MLREPTWVDTRLTTYEHILNAIDMYKTSIINLPRRVGKTASLLTIALNSTENVAIVTTDESSNRYIDSKFQILGAFPDSIGRYMNENGCYIYVITNYTFQRNFKPYHTIHTILFDECLVTYPYYSRCEKMCSVGTFSRFKIEGYVEIEWEDIKPIEENWKKYE